MRPPFRYTAYQLLVESELEIPGFPPAGEGTPDVNIRLGSLPAIPTGQRDKAPWVAAPQEMTVWIEGVATYRVREGREITVDPAMPVCPDDVVLFLRDGPLAALLMQRGLVPLHASAVDISRPGDGKVRHRFQVTYPEGAMLL